MTWPHIGLIIFRVSAFFTSLTADQVLVSDGLVAASQMHVPSQPSACCLSLSHGCLLMHYFWKANSGATFFMTAPWSFDLHTALHSFRIDILYSDKAGLLLFCFFFHLLHVPEECALNFYVPH